MCLNQNPQVKILIAKQLFRNVLGTVTHPSVLAPSRQSLWQASEQALLQLSLLATPLPAVCSFWDSAQTHNIITQMRCPLFSLSPWHSPEEHSE